MPQPLSRVRSSATIILGNAGDRSLARHPELAVLAIEAIASWSNVESFMLNLFIQLMGGNDSMAASVYLALEAQSAKNAAIKTAAEIALKGREQELRVLYAILSIIKTNEKERNKLAHWTWGDSPDIPDALLLVNPRTVIHELDRSDIYVYRAPDFQTLIHANDRLCGYGLKFNFVLRDHVANRDDRLLAELSSEPEIQQRLAQQKQSGESDP
ncbi:hypothetical protein EPO44_06370 [bacterium]|nr:MAG: hypothetical protein EPO44_06370 [bacterium]